MSPRADLSCWVMQPNPVPTADLLTATEIPRRIRRCCACWCPLRLRSALALHPE